MPSSRTISTAVLLAAIVAVLLIVLAAILFVATNDAGNQRLATLLALAAVVLPVLVGMLRGDQATQLLNGNLEQRIVNSVLRANYVRRASDVTPESATPAGLEAVINPSTTTPPETPPDEGIG